MRGGPRLLPAVTALLLAATASAAAEPGPADADRIAALVAQLGSDSYAEREAATKALEATGAAALAELRNASGSRDPEVARRAAALVRIIEKRLDTAKLLEPQKLRLRYKDTPLVEALADFAQRTGLGIKLHFDHRKVEGRKITLDTGAVTFWEALAQLCEKGGLAEAPPPAWTSFPDTITLAGPTVVSVGRNFGISRTDVLRAVPREKPAELDIMLGDIKSGPPPTSYAGAVRVRVALPNTASVNYKKPEGEVVFALEAASDGRLQWQKAVGLRLEKALDEDGRALAVLPGSGRPIDPALEDLGDPLARLVAVRLKQAGEKPPKGLRELTGTIVGQVRLPQEAVVTIDNVLKAAGRSAQGKHGGAVKVLSVAREADGGVRMKVQVQAVSRGVAEGPTNPLNVPIIVNGRRIEPDEDLLNSLNFALLDEKGKPFRTDRAVSSGVRAGAAHEYELTYEPGPGQAEAAKFVYSDRRTVLIDVPFAFEDVALP
jgi:hypothetical protein